MKDDGFKVLLIFFILIFVSWNLTTEDEEETIITYSHDFEVGKYYSNCVVWEDDCVGMTVLEKKDTVITYRMWTPGGSGATYTKDQSAFTGPWFEAELKDEG